MLVPGEYLINPTPQEPKPKPQPPTDRGSQPTRPATPGAEAKETEPRSFLLTLLRALGAMHT